MVYEYMGQLTSNAIGVNHGVFSKDQEIDMNRVVNSTLTHTITQFKITNKTYNTTNQCLILGHPTYGVLGTYKFCSEADAYNSPTTLINNTLSDKFTTEGIIEIMKYLRGLTGDNIKYAKVYYSYEEPPEWAYKRKIDINATYDVDDSPIWFKLTNSDVDFSKMDDYLADIRPRDLANTDLPYWIEYYQEDNLVYSLPLKGDVNAEQLTINQINAVNNGADLTAEGADFERADSSDKINIPQNEKLFNVGTDNFTISIWYKPESVVAGEYYYLFESNKAAGGYPQIVVRINDSGHADFMTYDGSAWTTVTSNATLSAGNWYHIVGVRSGTTHKIYINGSLDNSITGTVRNLSAGSGYDGYAHIGQTGDDTHQADGLIKEFKFYNVALSDSMVSTLNINGRIDERETKIWIKPNAQANVSKYFYLYYGNSNATDAQDLSGVFGTRTVSFWDLEVSANDMWGNNDGTRQGGQSGTTFDGSDDYISIPSFEVGNDITIVLKAKHSVTGVQQNLLGRDDGTNRYMQLYSTTGNNLQWLQSTTGGIFQINVVTSTTISTNDFIFAGTYDSSTGNAYAYIDGSSAGSDTASGTITTSSLDWWIGNVQTGSYYWDGNIYYIMIWDRALTSSEIAKLSIENPTYTIGTEQTISPTTINTNIIISTNNTYSSKQLEIKADLNLLTANGEISKIEFMGDSVIYYTVDGLSLNKTSDDYYEIYLYVDFDWQLPLLNYGAESIIKWIGNISSATIPQAIAWGNGTTDPSLSDTTMENELHRESVSIVYPNYNKVGYNAVLSTSDPATQPVNINRFGLFDANSGGNMWGHMATYNMTKTDRIQFDTTWFINFK